MNSKPFVTLAFILAILISVCVSAHADSTIIASGACGENAQWTLFADGQMVISGSGTMTNYGYNGAEYNNVPWSSYFSQIESLRIDEGITSIGDYSFGNCINLTYVDMPNTIERIGEEAFWNCSSLCELDIPLSVTSISSYAFHGCSSIDNIIVPEGLSIIENGTFKGCTGLKNISIPNTIKTINYAAFSNCDSLVSLSLPEGIEQIGYEAFYGCVGLETIVLPSTATSYESWCFAHCKKLTSIIIPDGTTSIGRYMFNGCVNLESVCLPASVLSIDEYAFNGCSMLKYVVLPKGVSEIKGNTFSGCSSLQHIIIPDSVTAIGNNAFNGCSSLKSLDIPSNVTTIGMNAFQGCSGLKSIVVPQCCVNGALYQRSQGTLGYILGESINCIEDITFADNVNTIGFYALAGCTSLINVNIPRQTTLIKDLAFLNCEKLSNICIPGNVKDINANVFDNCKNLSTITFMNGVECIGDEAFYGCINLKKIYLPESISTLGNDLFSKIPTIYCYEYSYVDGWAASNNLSRNVVYLNQNNSYADSLSISCDEWQELGVPFKLYANAFPYFNESISWISSDPDIVSVDKDGTGIGLAKGEATIVATIRDTLSASVHVKIYIPHEDFEFSSEEYYVIAKEQIQLELLQYPIGSESKFTWSSDNTACASVNSDGYITANSVGSAIIKAVDNRGIERTCLLHVCYPIASLTLDTEMISMNEGDNSQINASVITIKGEEYTNKLVTFACGDNSIAVVTNDGSVIGKSGGNTTIVATSGNFVAVCQLHVSCMTHDVVTDEALQPTCTSNGLTEGTHCQICNDILHPQSDITALGHDWGDIDYSWADDGMYVTAARICAHDNAHVETETVAATSEITKAATCEAKGETTYTSAAFENEAFTIQSKTLEDVAALGHDWGETTYIWSVDNKNVTASRTCAHDSEHVESETVSANRTLGKAPTDTEMGETLFTAVFTNEGFGEKTKTVADIPALNDLSLLRLPEMLKEIEEEVFMGLAVEGVIIADGCTTIGSKAFANCPNLIYVKIPASVTSIADDAFEGSNQVRIDRTE